jgi:pimeloyl-ACP methyl ester carboxylesterase
VNHAFRKLNFTLATFCLITTAQAQNAPEAVISQLRTANRMIIDDPAPILPEVRAPVLAINGSKDRQVPAWQNLPALRELFADHPDVTIIELEGLNHLFQTATTGAPGEYADIEETFAPVALDTITDWIAERMLQD